MSKVGAIAGALVISFYDYIVASYHALSIREVFIVGLVIWALSWTMTLVLFGIWLHYGTRRILIQTLVVTLVTALAIILVQYQLNLPLGPIFGFIIGMLIGYVICVICDKVFKVNTKKIKTHV